MSGTFTRKKIEGYSYGLTEVIGKGYSSQVYRGRHDETTQPVAIKVIDLRLLKNDINKVLLESEIQVLKELRDLPHILSLHEVYTTKNNTYIITQLCDSDLNRTIKKGLSEGEATELMTQVISGYLQFARKEIIHRDLKPANILVCEPQVLKIADFGFAIKTAEALKSNKYNVGSPLYMAPESLRRNQYSLKTDIWALGVIFYEMLTGETPWKAKNEKELVRRIESEKIEDLLPKVNASTSAKEFLRRTLRTDKATRMDLAELAAFSFGSNILAEKKLNIELRAMGNQPQTMPLFTPKTEKPEQQNRLFIERATNNENRRGSRDQSMGKFNSFRQESINHSLQLKATVGVKGVETGRKEAAGKENPEVQGTARESKQERKSISKILVSEIHFCRFLFKLLSKISESYRKGLLQHSSAEVEAVMRSYTAIIKHKIQNLARFGSHNFINASAYQDYKDTSDYTKLMKIAREYRERYSSELKDYWSSANSISKPTFSSTPTSDLVSHLYGLLQLRQHQQDFLDGCSREIVILDYLITSQQLIDLFKQGENYERFARKSRIEEIVEGKTADISRELYFKIMGRAKDTALPSSPPQDRPALVA